MDNGRKIQNTINGSLVPNPNANLGNLAKAPDLVENPTWAPEHNTKSLGGQAIFSSEALNQNPESMSQTSETAPQSINETPVNPNMLGEKVGLSQPVETPKLNSDDTSTDMLGFDKDSIKIVGDHLSKTGIKEVSQLINRLAQDGSADVFYDAARGKGGMVERALDNFFNRKLAA